MNQTQILKYGALLDFYKDKPLEFVIDILQVKPTTQQSDVLEALPTAMSNRTPIAIKSGHGVGKTSLLAWVILWFVRTRPFSKVPCTAGKEKQLKDILWPEIDKWDRKLPAPLRADWEWSALEYKNVKYSDWFAVARTANTPENMQGFHAPHLMFVIDEAPAVDMEIYEVIRGALSTPNSFMILTGNPTLLEGEFYNAFHKNRQSYKLFSFSSLDSPIVDPNYPKDIAERYGADGDVYRVRVLGEFPLSGEDALIPLSKVEDAIKRRDDKYEKSDVVYVGVDVARFGDDETAVCYRRGNKVIGLDCWRKLDTMETAGRVWHELRKISGAGLRVRVAVDDAGVGGGVLDRLAYLRDRDGEDNIQVGGVNNGSRANHEDQFFNRGAELWYAIRDRLDDLDLPDDERLTEQLIMRKYKINASGKIELEKKSDVKDRGQDSPDRADALSLTFAWETARRLEYAFASVR